MSDIIEAFNLVRDFISYKNDKEDEKIEYYIDNIFIKTENILVNYFDVFSIIRIKTISGEFTLNDVKEYLLKREYELKDVRVYVRSFLKDKFYQNSEVKTKFVAAIYGIMECYPVNNGVILDKSNHTIKSYIKFCDSLMLEDENTQKIKIIGMTSGILHDLTISWQTVCDCYKQLKSK